MTKKIFIKNTQNADSRTADDKLSKKTLYEATAMHRGDVNEIMDVVADMIIDRGVHHDYTKSIYFDEFAEEVLKPHTDTEFKNANWYQTHIFEERHHLNANCPLDVNLIDVIEMICDCVCAGMARSGEVRELEISEDILLRAVRNTVEMCKEAVVLRSEEE